MSLPGWYPDPSGQPGQFRYWNGQLWSAVTTTDPNSPPPPPPAAPTPQSSRLPIIVVAVVAVIALVAGLVWWSPWKPPVVEPTAPPPTQGGPTDPTPGTGSEEPTGGELTCTENNEAGMPGEQPEYVGAGMTYDAVPDFGFRLDASQWSWIDDRAAWGKRVEDGWFAGIVFGGVRQEYGFGPEPDDAAEAFVECLTTYGVWNSSDYQITDQKIEKVDVGGMSGVELTAMVSGDDDRYPGTAISILILDAGQPGSYGVFMSFWPDGDTESQEKIEKARETLKKV